MKKFALSLVLFFASMSVFAGCTKEDFVGKWWYQDQETIAQLNLSPGGYALFNLSGSPLRSVKSFEQGKARIYLPDCKLTLYRPNIEKHGDDWKSKDGEPKIIEQNGVITRSSTGQIANIGVFKGASMFRRDDASSPSMD